MDSPTPSLREQGIQALREGNLDQAVDLLARAVMADGQDAEAQAFLGVAYGQKGQHAQAQRALQTAIALQPAEPRYQFNLGVLLEQAGDASGAAGAYREALRLNPEHAQAQARLQALSAAPAAPEPGAPPLLGTTPPAAEFSPGTPWLGAQPPQTAGAAQPAEQAGPPGSVQCPSCKQWSRPGMSCEWCSSQLKRSTAAPTSPWLQSPTGSESGQAPTGPAIYVAPEMGSGEAFGRRFAAYLIDGIIVLVLVLLLYGAFYVMGVDTGRNGLSFLIQLGVMLGYSAGMLTARGATLGKFALGLRVIGPDGENPAFWRAALRETVGKWISGLVVALGYLWMLWDESQQCWHDKIAGTTVERA